MKHYQQGVILQRILKLICCGGFILHLTGCGLKGPLYIPPEPAQEAIPSSPTQQEALTPPQTGGQQE